MRAYAERIREARLQKGLTQEQLAEAIGANVGTVSRWEAGRTIPTAYYLSQLTQVLGIQVHDLGLKMEPTEYAPVRSFEKALPVPVLDTQLPSMPLLIGREHEQEALLHELIAPLHPTPLVLYGLPGIGKTALMASLACDMHILEHFSDGVLWASLGSAPNYVSLFARWGLLLNIELPPQQEIWPHIIKQVIRQRRLLMLLDDARTSSDVQLLSLVGPQGAIMVTTRLPTLAATLSSQAHAVRELNQEQSWQLLEQIAPIIVHDHHASLETLREAIGGHPLVLTLVGRYLQQQTQSGHPRRLLAALGYLQEASNRLCLPIELAQTSWFPGGRVFQDQVDLLAQPENTSSLTLASLLAEMVHALPLRQQEVLLTLSLLPAQPQCFSEEMALAIGGCDAATLDALLDSGLLSAHESCYQMHPVIRDYAAWCLSQKDHLQALALVRLFAYAISVLEHWEQQILMREPEEAMLRAALDLAWAHQYTQEALRLTQLLSAFWFQHHAWKEAETYFTQALAIARQQIHHPHYAISCLFGLGRCALAREKITQAREYYREAVVYARMPEADDESLILALSKVAAVALQMAEEHPHMHYAQDVKTSCEEALWLLHHLTASAPNALLSSRMQALFPVLYEMLGTVSLEAEGTLAALNAYHQGVALAERFQRPEVLCWLLLQQGTVLLYREEWSMSEQTIRRALMLAQQERLDVLLLLAYERLFEVLLLTQRFTEAHQLLTQWQEMSEQDLSPTGALWHERLMLVSNPRHTSLWTTLACGRLLLVQHHLEAAHQHYTRALHQVPPHSEPAKLLRHLWHDLAVIALRTHNIAKALEYIGELQGLVPSSTEVLWQAYIFYRRAQLLLLLGMPAQGYEDALRGQAIFRQRNHQLGLHDVDAWLASTSIRTEDRLPVDHELEHQA
ncbi:NB-ARC domain-containing protein [Ktedonospora formicarum]|uniref:HTH cro/C1-type domain-containing protein n=1 Tax=Ktedonospora formicarum TaxID=2778364 RepID=A0A8J3I8C8_9CHLR|nr:NB-ARC domain-containing protein [Ktedonospora formicarum]GHO48705.1 hypothetical protein KSX_68680 [Ktedonospora formicarum]